VGKSRSHATEKHFWEDFAEGKNKHSAFEAS
jgi:hypothetical protein